MCKSTIEDVSTFQSVNYNCERWAVKGDGANIYGGVFGVGNTKNDQAFSVWAVMVFESESSLHCV